MYADDVGDHGLERRERGLRQMLMPGVCVGLAQLLAIMGIKLGHGSCDDTRRGPLWYRWGIRDCAPCKRSGRAGSANGARRAETRAERLSSACPPPPARSCL